MSMDLRWKASLSATCLQAVAQRRVGASPAADWATALDEPAAALLSVIESAGWPVEASVLELAGLAGEIENNQALVDQTARRLVGPAAAGDASAIRIAAAVAALEAALLRSQPQIVEELAARGRPLREQWEARGPGVMRAVQRFTEDDVVPRTAEVVLVGPYAGGGGLAHLKSNRVLLEAVLFNPLPELPEVLRLAWFLVQLNGDLPRYAECLPMQRSARMIQLAMLPPVLAAAEVVELATFDESLVTTALGAWGLANGDATAMAQTLLHWWSAFDNRATRWPAALAALDAMLSP